MTVLIDGYRHWLVDVPGGGKVLLLMRRNIGAKAAPRTIFEGMDWSVATYVRLFRRDRTWRVEDYGRFDADPVNVPSDEPGRYWVCRDKHAAIELAERIAKLLATDATLPPSPDPDRVL